MGVPWSLLQEQPQNLPEQILIFLPHVSEEESGAESKGLVQGHTVMNGKTRQDLHPGGSASSKS